MNEARQEVLDIPEINVDHTPYVGRFAVAGSLESLPEPSMSKRQVVDVAFNGTTSIIIGRPVDASGQPIPGSVPHVSFEERLF